MNDAVTRLWHRLRLVIGRGRTTQVDDTKPAQVHQVRMGADELRDGTPRVAEYGFVSNPPPGTDVIVVFVAGDRTNGVIVGTNNQTFRMRSLASGETAIHDDKGRFVLLAADGITVEGNNSPIMVHTTSDVTADVGGNLSATVGGDVTVSATGAMKLSAASIELDAQSMLVNVASVEVRSTTVAVTAAVNVTGATTLTGETAITGDTSIAGSLTNNGHNIGNTHQHQPGTFKANTTNVTGTSGGVTP